MAYEAFARALENVSGDYARMRMEERLHSRDRSEKQSDLEDARKYQKEWFEQQNKAQLEQAAKMAEINTKADIDRARQMSEAEKDRLDQELGVSITDAFGNPRSPADRAHDREHALQELNSRKVASEVDATKKAGLDTENKYFGEEQSLKDKQLADDRQSLYGQYQGVLGELNKVRQAANVPMEDPSIALDGLAKQKLQQSIPQDPNGKAAFWKAAAQIDPQLATPQGQLAFVRLPAVEQAKTLGLITENDEKLAQRNAIMNMTQDMRTSGYDISGLQQRLQLLDQQAVKLGVNPYVPWEAQPFNKRGAPAAAPASSGNFLSPQPAAPMARPMPAAPAPAPTPSPAAPQSDNYGGLIGWISNNGVPNPLSVPMRAGDTLGNLAAGAIGGPKLQEQRRQMGDTFWNGPGRAVADWYNKPSPMPLPTAEQVTAAPTPAVTPNLMSYFRQPQNTFQQQLDQNMTQPAPVGAYWAR